MQDFRGCLVWSGTGEETETCWVHHGTKRRETALGTPSFREPQRAEVAARNGHSRICQYEKVICFFRPWCILFTCISLAPTGQFPTPQNLTILLVVFFMVSTEISPLSFHQVWNAVAWRLIVMGKGAKSVTWISCIQVAFLNPSYCLYQVHSDPETP